MPNEFVLCVFEERKKTYKTNQPKWMPPPPRMEWDKDLKRNVLNLNCCTQDRNKPDRGCVCTIS